MLPESFFDETGKLKPVAVRLAERKKTEQSAAHIARQVAERTATEPSHDERLQAATAARIESYQDELRGYLHSDERARIVTALTILKRESKAVSERLATEARQQKFAESADVKRAREHAEAFLRTPPPGADPQAVKLAHAIASSSEFSDPKQLASEYFAVVSQIEQATFDAADKAATLASEGSLKAQADEARGPGGEVGSPSTSGAATMSTPYDSDIAKLEATLMGSIRNHILRELKLKLQALREQKAQYERNQNALQEK